MPQVDASNAKIVEVSPGQQLADTEAEFRRAVQAATSLQQLKAALLGDTGPGAEPRRR